VPDFDFLDEDIDVRDQELTMAKSLIETLTGGFDPTQYTDAYREALQAVIEAKIEGREVVQPEGAQPTSGTVVELMAALRASDEAAKAEKGDPEEKAEAARTAKKEPAKKAAKKAPAKKAPAKKTNEKTTDKTTEKAASRKKSA
jgi:DNA end-binding protein Ku